MLHADLVEAHSGDFKIFEKALFLPIPNPILFSP